VTEYARVENSGGDFREIQEDEFWKAKKIILTQIS